MLKKLLNSRIVLSAAIVSVTAVVFVVALATQKDKILSFADLNPPSDGETVKEIDCPGLDKNSPDWQGISCLEYKNRPYFSEKLFSSAEAEVGEGSDIARLKSLLHLRTVRCDPRKGWKNFPGIDLGSGAPEVSFFIDFTGPTIDIIGGKLGTAELEEIDGTLMASEQQAEGLIYNLFQSPGKPVFEQKDNKLTVKVKVNQQRKTYFEYSRKYTIGSLTLPAYPHLASKVENLANKETPVCLKTLGNGASEEVPKDGGGGEGGGGLR